MFFQLLLPASRKYPFPNTSSLFSHEPLRWVPD
nr:MAG TPA: hypothetical protein [Caudoviricetes sp.]